MDSSQQARIALESWRQCAHFDLAHALPPARYVSPVLPDEMTTRIHRALQGCQNAQDIDLVFVQVQEHQLVG